MIVGPNIAFGIAVASFVAGGALAWKYKGAQLETCAVERASLSADIEDQNKAIAALSAQGKETTEKLAKALEATTPAAKSAESRVAQRKALPVPKSCDAAFDLLDAEK